MLLIGQKISVLGAGIGGLTVATALAHRGAQVTIYEQAPEIKEVGAGLQISPNGFAVLRALGMGDALRNVARRGRRVELLDFRRGGPVFSLDLDVNGDGFPYYFVHRADLIGLLEEAARAAGVEIKLGQRIEAVDVSAEAPRLKLEDGTEIACDILLGADGLHSKVRAALNGEAPPRFTGQVAWRAIVPSAENSRNETTVKVYMGPGCHLVCYPLRDGSMTNIVAVQERDLWADEGWNHADNPDNLRTAFAAFRPEVQALLAKIKTTQLWGLFRHPVAPIWHKNNAAILGDAAHPTLPFLAQGAVMALEDAWVLADAMIAAETADQAFALYQNTRFSRVSRIIEAASQNARNYHLRPGPFRTLAHGALKLGSHIAPQMAAKKFDWIYTHDVTKNT
ncbi:MULTISPECIES: FAD-dependent monooxygenase [Falsihalocynthiibacter]|uniref:FAD-dependent monooxygenase n=1 Tax=Falsihalocynthiibacter TaxID=2854182 RepID=UPI00300276B0